MSNDNSNLLYTRKRPSFASEVKDVFQNFPHYSLEYIKSIFPIKDWIGRYNLTWFTGDLIAGLTVGAVIIPQAMGFATIIGIPVEYGLYSSFVGMLIYCIFATAKDMTIGPTAVMSLILAQNIPKILEDYSGTIKYSKTEVATCICLFSGVFSLVIGFLRLGWVFNYIPGPVISGYITASVITISIGQLPNLFGITGVETRTNPPYRVLIDFFAAIGRTKIDAAIGLVSLAFLYAVKIGCSYGGKRFPKYKKFLFFTSILRYIVCILVTTLIAWLLLKDKKEKAFQIRVVKTVPRGLKHIKVPPLETELVGSRYYILVNPSQEIIAIGITNVIGCFLGSVTATGSFSRSALKSKTGVRTPFAGVFSALFVLLALYVLTPAFYYIPQAALAAIIIQAVLVLLVSPSYIKMLYQVQIWDLAVFAVAIIVSMVNTLDNGILASWGFAILIILIRIGRPHVDALGQLVLTTFGGKDNPKHAYVPLDHPSFTTVANPPDGIIIFRFKESITFPNATFIDDAIVDYVRLNTRRMYQMAVKKGDQPWNENYNLPRNEKLPELRAIIFDCSAVALIDSSGLQSLLDVKKSVNKHSARNVEYHFANILEEHVQNALLNAGFGVPETSPDQFSHKSGANIEIIEENNEKRIDEENNINHIPAVISVTSKKRFFHFTIEEAILAAQNP
ncbi:9435_t:CDS:2 [Diversispora eburnea]|uniref:9435_t:CDS:1 n=1 Tax=Diversispora eburnea TaxID=1213867 RepID=A0A9N9FEJ8_9GLOM|nr:9435_t:CDS:2 [Diversispora eburnea]